MTAADREPGSRSTNDSGSARATPGIWLILLVSFEAERVGGVGFSWFANLTAGKAYTRTEREHHFTAASATTSYSSVIVDWAYGTQIQAQLSSPERGESQRRRSGSRRAWIVMDLVT